LIKAPFAFTEDFGHFFVLEFMPGGDLSKILNDEGYLEEKHAKFYLA
jgi:serine/threonine protein kinase